MFGQPNAKSQMMTGHVTGFADDPMPQPSRGGKSAERDPAEKGGFLMKRGDIVKYSRPVDETEAAFRFVLLGEPEKGRVDIQLICDDRIKPVETVEAGEVELDDAIRYGGG